MKRKVFGVLFAVTLTASLVLSGCAGSGQASAPAAEPSEAAAEEVKEEPAEAPAPADEEAEGETAESGSGVNEEAIKKAAELIDAIYVQEWTPDTEKQCADAKAAWDALTDEEKEMVEGEEADPDYFGRDTGDASLDDPLNQDGIGDKEILVVSFGTSFNDSRVKTIGGIEKAIAAAYPDWAVRRAFTAQIIINHILARDNEKIDNMEQALKRAVDNGVKDLVVQPTHLMHGAEYDELTEVLDSYKDKFEHVAVAEPLLGEVGEDETIVNADKKAVAESVTEAAYKDAGFDSLDSADKDGTAFVFMGHGTSHKANVTYNQMQTQMKELKYGNVFIGTVEGEPEDTECSVVIAAIKDKGYKKVILRPLMVVAGDHANNDMAGDDDDSWKSMFSASGAFDEINCQIAGLGEIPDIQKIYVEHTGKAIESMGGSTASSHNTDGDKIADGTYEAEFNTDSSMFHVNEACDGKGKLTVKDGKMVIHVSLPSKNIVNLFSGKAEDAKKPGAELIEPTVDKVTYSDGTSEEVNGFDIPVPSLDKEFDVALIGTKGKWYDHKVSVSKVG